MQIIELRGLASQKISVNIEQILYYHTNPDRDGCVLIFNALTLRVLETYEDLGRLIEGR